MTTTDPALPTSEDGGGLAEEARAAFREAYATFKRGYDWHDEEAVQAGFDAMQPIVAALLSQARADATLEEWVLEIDEETIERGSQALGWPDRTDNRRDLALAVIAAVLPDLVRAERDRVRGECAEELRALFADDVCEQARIVSEWPFVRLAASWSTPDPGEPRESDRMDYDEEEK